MNKEVIEEQIQYIRKVKEMMKNEKKYYNILTMGCQLNENDSEKLAGMLEEMGYKPAKNGTVSDIYILNTCCVRENAEEKLFGKVGELKKIKQKNNSIIAVCGCIYEGLPIKRNSNKSASVTIMYGCNNFCSYCIVPYVRGRERSRNPEDIIAEIEQLSKEGYKEVTLLGQNVNSYMRTEKKENRSDNITSFADLLRAVNKIQGIEVIKFISPHPKDFTEDVIQAIKECKKVSRLIHLPLQSGSTEVLRKMNRKYTKEQYLELVSKIKTEIPEAVFSTDIIVGFPEETEKDFQDTLDVVKKVNFEQIFMFIYSRRKGTPADKMESQIPEEIKHKRFDRLKELFEKQVELNNKKYIGTIQKILVEGTSINNDKMLTGRTTTNKIVNFEGSKNLVGQVIEVKIVSEHKWYLKGEKIF